MLAIFYYVLFYASQLFLVIMLISVITSYIPSLLDYKIFRNIKTMSNWYLEPFRGVIVLGPIDFTPIIGFIVYNYITFNILNIISNIK